MENSSSENLDEDDIDGDLQQKDSSGLRVFNIPISGKQPLSRKNVIFPLAKKRKTSTRATSASSAEPVIVPTEGNLRGATPDSQHDGESPETYSLSSMEQEISEEGIPELVAEQKA